MLLVLLLLSALNLTLIAPVWILRRDILLLEVLMHAILFFVAVVVLLFGTFNAFSLLVSVILAYVVSKYCLNYFQAKNQALDLLIVNLISGFYGFGVLLLAFLLKHNYINYDLSKSLILGNPVFLSKLELNYLVALAVCLLGCLLYYLYKFLAGYFLVSKTYNRAMMVLSIAVQYLILYCFGIIPSMALAVMAFFLLQDLKLNFKQFLKISLAVNILAVMVAYALYAQFTHFIFGPTVVLVALCCLLPLRFFYAK